MRAQVVRHKQTKEDIKGKLDSEAVAMRVLSHIFRRSARYEQAQRLARRGQVPFARNGSIDRLPPPLNVWTTTRDLEAVPQQSFRDWGRERQQGSSTSPHAGADGVGDVGGVNVEVAEAVGGEP